MLAFTDDLIRAAVKTGEYSDPAAEKLVGDVLIKRRQKIASVYLTAVNPIVSPKLDANNRLTFENAAMAAGVADGRGHVSRRLGAVRQRHGADASALANTKYDHHDRGAERPPDDGRQLHRGEHLRRQREVSDVGASDQDALPPAG